MNVVIIEDEALSAKRLAKLITEVYPKVKILALLASVNEALSWFEKNDNPDIIFLDIELNDGTGFEVVKKLSDYPHIIFTTAYEKYALDAFKFNSIDYLLKPIDKNELRSAIQKLEQIHQIESASYRERLVSLSQQFTPAFRERFLIKIGLQFKSISTHDICYFYYQDGLSYIQTKEKCLPIDHTLDQLMEELDPKTFFRINRQYIVHTSAVQEIHAYFNSRLLLTLDPVTEEEVIVSRERVLTFKVWAGL